jgi:DNA-binding LacI/PurR family transcriptional regulator
VTRPAASDSHSPVYQRLFDRYRDDILAFRIAPGARIDSIVEMQQKYQVGRETAKRVLGMLAAEGYIVQRRGKGSFVADQRPRQKVLGLVLPHYAMQYEELLFELSSRVQALGRAFHHCCHYNDFHEEVRLVGKMLHGRYEAVAVIPTLDESQTWKGFYSKLPLVESSVVLLNHTMTSNDFRYVIQSYDLGVTRALLYMLAQKPGTLVFIENEMWPGRNMVLELMRGTYLEIMRTRRPGDEPLVLARAAAVDWRSLRARGVTGIFCCDDLCAAQTIGRLKEQGARVPEDLHVVSYGNTELARFFTPAISSVDPHNAEMAAVLCQLLYAPGDDPAKAFRQHVIQPDLVIRGT